MKLIVAVRAKLSIWGTKGIGGAWSRLGVIIFSKLIVVDFLISLELRVFDYRTCLPCANRIN